MKNTDVQVMHRMHSIGLGPNNHRVSYVVKLQINSDTVNTYTEQQKAKRMAKYHTGL